MNNITSIEFITPDVDPTGTQVKLMFNNGWGASIVKHRYSYGFEEGLWELAVIKNNELNYDNPLTNDVLGNLSDNELNEYLETIASWGRLMPKRKEYCSKRHGTPNGACSPIPVKCTVCSTENTHLDWYCKNCKRCLDCQRLVKKYYK
jgi:hypothetical protein